MKKNIILIALTMVSPFVTFAHEFVCITNDRPFCNIGVYQSVKYEEGKAIYGPTNYTLWSNNNNIAAYTSTDEEKVVALAISHAENGRCKYCIYGDDFSLSGFSANGNEVNLDSLD